MVALHQRLWDEGLDGARKAAALHPPRTASPGQQMLAQRQRRGEALMPHIGGAVDVLAEGEGCVSAGLDQPKKGREVPRPQRIPLGEGAGVLLKIVDGPQHGPVPARLPQPGQGGPEIRRLHLTEDLCPQLRRHSLHLLPDGRKLAGQLAVAAPRVGHAEGHSGWQQPRRMDLLDLRGSRVGKVRKDDAAHRAGQLIQQAAGLAEVGVLCILADLCQLRSRQAAVIFSVQDHRHPHLECRRAGQAGPPQHIAGGVGVEAADGLALGPEALRNAPDEAGGVGALAILRLGLAQVDDVQLVEPAGFYPDEAVIAGRRHGHKVEHHRRRQPVAVLVVGVVAAKLRPPRRGVEMHLPPRPEIEFELLQRGGIPLPLPGQHRRVCAIQRGKGRVLLPCQDLLSELCTGRHSRSSPKNTGKPVRKR